MRKKLTDLLKDNGYRVYSIGQIETPQKDPYLVLLISDSSSIPNPYGRKQMIEILCYTPDTSIFRLDEIVENIKNLIMKEGYGDEFTGIGTDYHDTQLKAYMRNIKFEVPVGNLKYIPKEVG